MLSISLIKDSGSAASYYEKDDYYAAKGDHPNAQGQWYGKTADALGLSGSVDKEKFEELMDGKLPDGTALGRWRDGEREHTPGWDMTFSAPKSVSLMYELGGDKRVLEAHQTAVKEAVGWLEDNATSVHKKGFLGRKTEETGNLAVALFDHDTNRNQDPQLHTHAVMLNVTQCDDGRCRSMYSKPFFQQKMTGGNVYRAALAQELQKAGYQIEQTHSDGRFQISGIETKVLDAFSTRRQAIEADMKDRGTEGPEAAEESALRTRSRKENLDRSELTAAWKERANEIGFEAGKYVARASDRAPPAGHDTQRAALNAAVSRLSEQEAVFTHEKLVGQVLADGMGKLGVRDAERLIRDEQKSGGLYASQLGEQKAWTTKAADKQERRINQAMNAGQDAVESLMSSKKLDLELKDTTLGDGQKNAIKLMLSGKDQFVGVLGRPGTGKTFMLNKARELYERHGYTMVGMASNAEAAGQLSESAGVESKTLARHLIDAGKEIYRRKTELTPAQRLEERDEMRQVWVIDEASQVNNRDLSRLASMSRTLGARVVLVGDPQQLGAIEAGKPFTRMLDTGLRHTELDDIRRQSKSEHISAIRSMIAGDVSGAMQTLSDQTREITDSSDRLKAIVDTWTKLEDRDNAMVITSRQATKNDLNDQMREVLRQEGKLEGERETAQLMPVFSSRADLKLSSTYNVGDTVRFNQDAKSIGVKNGEYLNVVGADEKTNTVRLQSGDKSIDWNPRKVGTGLNQSAQLFRASESSVAEGETIIWSRNNSELGLRNGQRLTVTGRDENWMTVQTEDGRSATLDLARQDHRHWEHGYASTIYKSQGKTGQDILVHAPTEDKELLSQKAFLVAISRQKENISLFTDDREKLERNVKDNLGDKTSAIEGQSDRRWFDITKDLMKSAEDWVKTLNEKDRAENKDSGQSPTEPKYRDAERESNQHQDARKDYEYDR